MGDSGFPSAFAEALSRRGVSLSWLHERLVEVGHPVSPAALSYWRSGRSRPERRTSRAALVEIERLLGVDPGVLTSSLGPSRRPGPRPAERTLREMLAQSPGMAPALAGLGFEGLDDELVERVRHLAVDVGADGRIGDIRIQAVMQARYDGARRTPLIVTADEHGRVSRFVPGAGCELGRVFEDPSGVYATELLLERPLARGETHPYELVVQLDAADDTTVDHYAARRLTELLVWVRFHADRRPAHVERFSVEGGRERRERLDLGHGASAHTLAHGFGPGILGVRWGW